jgi:hypothetical protein
MVVLEKKTKKKTDEVLRKAKLFFGSEGEGLVISSEGDCCITFEGSGGYVTVTVSGESVNTRIKVESREWDYQAKKFLDVF